MTIFSSILGEAKSAVGLATGSVSAAISAAASGNLTGALDQLVSAPSSIINSIGSGGGAAYGDYAGGMNARKDAMQNWSWYCIMPSVKSSNATSVMGLQPSVSLPWYYIQKMNMPSRVFKRDTFARNGHEAHYAEGYSVSDLTLEFFMDSSNKSYQYLKAWQGLILGNQDPSTITNQGRWGMPADYKKNINLCVLSVDKKILLNVKYIGCWPVDPSALELTSSSAEAIPMSVTFAVEDMDITVKNDKGIIDNLLNTASGYAIDGIQDFAKTSLSKLF